MPAFRQFDYNTVSDVILHLRYTAREGGSLLRNRAVEWVEQRVGEANASGLAILLSLKHEFPGEWHRFVMSGTGAFTATVKRDHFPYFTKAREITIDGVQLYAIKDGELGSVTLTDLGLADLTGALNDSERHAFELTLAPDTEVLSPTRGRWSSS